MMELGFKGKLEVHHYLHGDVAGIGDVLNRLIDSVNQAIKEFGMVRADIKALTEQFDRVTTEIANRFATLVQNAQGLNDEEKALFQKNINVLTALGKDPENPFPPLPPA